MGLFRKLENRIKEPSHKEFFNELKWMCGYARKYWKFVAVHIVIGILGTLMSLAGTLASKYLIDTVTGYGTASITYAAIAMVGMMAGNIAAKAIGGRISAKISVRVQNEIQYEVYEKIMGSDWESLSEYRSGDLLNRINGDVSTAASSIIGFIPSFITHLVQFLGALVIILCYDPIMALIALVGAPVTMLVSRVLLKKMRTYNHELRKISSELMSFEDESFQNIQSIKAFDVSDVYTGSMDSLQDKYKEMFLKFNKFSIKTSSLVSSLSSVVSLSCMGWGVYRLWSGMITFGTMTLFLQLASSLSGAFSSLASLVPSAIGAATSAGRIIPIIDLPAEEAANEREVDEIARNIKRHGVSIRLKDVSFAYKNGAEVLKNVNINAEPGEIVAIVGPSGEGKTTLIRILLGLVKPSLGSAKLHSDGVECQISAASRRFFAYVPQGNTAFPGTVMDNMRLVRSDATDSEVLNALSASCAYDFVMKLPNGTDTLIGEQGKGLSEGQAQRISIARAVLRDSPVLLLDEATSALDIAMERKVLNNIITEHPNKTCIVTTHRPSVLSMCRRIYKIEATNIEEVSPEERERMLMDF